MKLNGSPSIVDFAWSGFVSVFVLVAIGQPKIRIITKAVLFFLPDVAVAPAELNLVLARAKCFLMAA